MPLILRYISLVALSLALPVFTLIPSGATYNGSVDLLVRALYIPIYASLSVFLMTSFNPAKLRRKLLQTATKIDDIHLWSAPFMVMLAFLWAGLVLIALLAQADFHDSHPFVFLGLFIGAIGLAIWVAIRVRRAFFYGD